MPVTLPPAAALKEFLSPSTRHTRRVEIYEADGVTRWSQDTVNRLKDGSVSVDYDRDERRSLELTLSNTDGGLVNAPGEFWYDKIIKVYRGVQVGERRRLPKVLVVADRTGTLSAADGFTGALTEIGFGDIRINPLADDLLDLVGYDIIVNLNVTEPSKIALINAAWEQGYRILTFGNGNKATYPQFFPTTAVNYTATTPTGVSPNSTSTHPVARGWTPITFNAALANQTITTTASVGADKTVVATWSTGAAIIARTSVERDRRWLMYAFEATSGMFGDGQFRNFLLSALNWLNPVVPIQNWEVQIGEFMIDRISESHFPHDVKITGRDYTKKCMLSKFAQATQFDAGQSLEAIIAAIAGTAGITKRILPVTGITVGRAFFWERGTTRWAAMKEIANAYNYEIYFDATGYLVIRPFNDPSTTAPVVYIETGREGQIASYEKSTTDTRIFNHVVVYQESAEGDAIPIWAEAINNDPNSPTSVQNLGDRVFEYPSAFIETEQQAQELANSLLAINGLEEFDLSFESLMLPWLEVGDILGWVDPNPAPDDPSTFLLSTLSLPLKLGPMGGNGKRVTIVGA